MIKCIIPCIYYREIFDKSKNPTCKIICDRNGEELKNISNEEKEQCIYFKNFQSIKWKT
jgi:hypothetical protein